MADEAQVVLAQLLQQHGRELAQDPRRLRAMLADTMPGTADAKRLVAAAEEGIPDQLLTMGSDETGAARLQLIRRLEEQRDMTPQAAAWTVDTWAAAMEVPLRQSDPVVTGPIPGPIPGPVPGPGTGGGFGDETIPQDHSRDDLPPPRRPWWPAALAAAVLLGVVVVALIFFLRPADNGTAGASITPTASPSADASVASEAPSEEPSDAPPSEEPPPSEPPPSADPLTPSERELLGWIPDDVRDSCEVTSLTGYGNPQAQMECNVPGLVSTAYLMYRGSTPMRVQYNRIVQTPKGTGRCSEGRLPSETTWSSANDDESLGRISCFRDAGDLWVVWTAEYANLLMWGYRTDGNHEKLFEAWADHAGPLLP